MIAVSSQRMNDRQNKLQSLPSLASLFLTHTETPPATPDMMWRGIEGELKQRFLKFLPQETGHTLLLSIAALSRNSVCATIIAML